MNIELFLFKNFSFIFPINSITCSWPLFQIGYIFEFVSFLWTSIFGAVFSVSLLGTSLFWASLFTRFCVRTSLTFIETYNEIIQLRFWSLNQLLIRNYSRKVSLNLGLFLPSPINHSRSFCAFIFFFDKLLS